MASPEPVVRFHGHACASVEVGGDVGHADEEGGWVNTDAVDPKAYALHAAAWLDAGARIIGSCCGTTPAHTKALRMLINGRSGVFGGTT